MKRRITCLLTGLTFTFSLFATSTAFAINLDNNLSELGVPQDLIEMMPEEQKQMILENNAVFESYEKLHLMKIHQIHPFLIIAV